MNSIDKKANSTSTIFVNGTISNPNLKQVIKAVSALLHSIIIEDIKEGKSIVNTSDFYNFCEDKYIIENPENYEKNKLNYFRKIPTQQEVFEFIEVIHYFTLEFKT